MSKVGEGIYRKKSDHKLRIFCSAFSWTNKFHILQGQPLQPARGHDSLLFLLEVLPLQKLYGMTQKDKAKPSLELIRLL